MKRILIAIISIVVFQTAWAQDQDTLTVLMKNSQFREAIKYIESVEPSKELRLKKVFCYKALSEYRKAKDELLTLSTEYPDDVPILSELANCFESLGQIKSSLECYERLIEMDSTNLFFKLKKGDLLYNNEKYSDALEIYKPLFERDSLNSSIKRIAQTYDKLQEPDTAAMYYEHALYLDSTDINAAANLINLQIKTKNYFKAIKISDYCIERDSTNATMNLLNALSYYGADEYEKAVPRFLRCYNNNDTSLIVNRSLGISLYSLSRNKEALPHLEAAFRQDTLNNNVLYCLAVTYSDLNRPNESLNCYLKLIDRLTPKNLEMYLYNKNAGSQYNNMGDFANAAEYYKRSLLYGDNIQNVNQYYTIAELYYRELNEPQKALEYYNLYKKALIEAINKHKQKPEEEMDEFDLSEYNELRLGLKTIERTINQIKNKTEIDNMPTVHLDR